jgi:anaerobic ribonucleoside-triphosphate reductase activating protein
MDLVKPNDMKIAINKAHFPVTVLGPGRRIGIWLQGCSIGCKGCVSQDTWAKDPGRLMDLAALLAWCRKVAGGQIDGVTLSGGEPFDQPQALAALLTGLHNWRKRDKLDFDILCYSGYPLAKLERLHAPLLARLDALIPEPFQQQQPVTHVWRGSGNQPLVLLSARGRVRYAEFVDAAPFDGAGGCAGGSGGGSIGKRMQMMVDGQKVWYVGIPERGDMAALEAACQAQGVVFSSVSWRP